MPAGFMQLVNHTSRKVHYHNLESNFKRDIEAHEPNNQDIPSCNFNDDTIPFRSSSHIEIYFDSEAKMIISDDNYQFYIYGPVPYSKENEGARYGKIYNGCRFILRLDEVIYREATMCAVTILTYEKKFQAVNDFVDAREIQQASPVAALVFMDIFSHGTMNEGSKWDALSIPGTTSHMSEHTHKRKHILQDSTVDLSKMRMVLTRLAALKDDLDGIEETEEELHTISEHVVDLENILKGAKKPRATFSTVASEDLKKAGVNRKRLVFEPAKVAELTSGLTTKTSAEIADLHSRVKKIYARVNMDYEPGSRMILDAILLALAEISSTTKRGVAILPEMRIAQGDGVQISHPVSGYELWLSGNVDYAVIEYDDVGDYKDRLLAPGGSREDAFEIAKGRLFLVQAKRQSLEQSLVSYIPEAVSQAIALLKSANLPEVRFCLSDGQSWIFFILKSENGMLTYYESATRRLSRDVVENTDLPLREIVQLVCEWLSPTETELFTLE